MPGRSVLSRALGVVVVSLLAPGCAASPPSVSPGAEFIRLSPTPVIEELVAHWAERWSGATGVDIELGEGGKPLDLVVSIQDQEGAERAGWTSPDRSRALVHYRARNVQTATGHEIAHLLGGDHGEGDGILGRDLGPEGRRNVIDAVSLASVCARLACLWMAPEE
jgi:hypothetical protein